MLKHTTMSLGNTNDVNNKGHNYAWQRAVIELLKSISTGLSPITGYSLQVTQLAVEANLAAILNYLTDTPNKPLNPVRGYSKNITDTNAHDVVPAGGLGIKNYINQILVTNEHASVGTLVDIIEETTGTILYTGFAAAGGGGFSVSFPTPLVQDTTNKKIQAQCTTTGSNVTVSISGYKI